MAVESLVLFHYQAYSFHCESILQQLGYETCFIPTPKQYGEMCANSLRVKNITPDSLIPVLDEQGIEYAEVHTYKQSRLADIFLKTALSAETENIFKKIREDQPLEEEDIRFLWQMPEAELEELYKLADKLKQKTVDKDTIGVYVQMNNSNSLEKIKNLADKGYKNWLFVLDDDCTDESLQQTLECLAGEVDIAVTGNNPFRYFKILRKAGIQKIFKGLGLEEANDYSINEDKVLEELLALWREGKTSMLGISPVLPILDEFSNVKAKQLTAILRILFRYAQIPAFNILCSISDGQELRLCGADLYYRSLEEIRI